MRKPNLMPVFVSAEPYAHRRPAQPAEAMEAIIEHTLLISGHDRADDGARAIAITAIRIFIHQLQASLAAHMVLPEGATFDQMREAEKRAAQQIPFLLTESVTRLDRLAETEAERATREELEARDYMRDRLRTEAQLDRMTPGEGDDEAQAQAA